MRARVARPAGFEPTTARLEGGCSIQLSYRREREDPAVGVTTDPSERKLTQLASGGKRRIRSAVRTANISLERLGRERTLPNPRSAHAPIVYRLGQEILILQSGVRFPVGAPLYL